MITLRKIIVATDFSRLGSCAVSRAALLAQEHGSELVLVHVIPDAEFEWVGATGPDGSAGTVFSREKFAQTALERLSSTARGIEERYGVACQPKVVSGRTPQCIATAAADADLVVLGARGEHSVRRWFTGSTAQKILRISPCPTLLVRGEPTHPYASVLAPVDFSPNSFAALKILAAWLATAAFHVAHAFEHPYEGMMRYAGVDQNLIEKYRRKQYANLDAELQNFMEAAGAIGTSFVRQVEHGHAKTVIENLIDELRPDLVAMAAHGESNLEEAFLGSVSLHAALESPCDVLVFRGQRFTSHVGATGKGDGAKSAAR